MSMSKAAAIGVKPGIPMSNMMSFPKVDLRYPHRHASDSSVEMLARFSIHCGNAALVRIFLIACTGSRGEKETANHGAKELAAGKVHDLQFECEVAYRPAKRLRALCSPLHPFPLILDDDTCPFRHESGVSGQRINDIELIARYDPPVGDVDRLVKRPMRRLVWGSSNRPILFLATGRRASGR